MIHNNKKSLQIHIDIVIYKICFNKNKKQIKIKKHGAHILRNCEVLILMIRGSSNAALLYSFFLFSTHKSLKNHNNCNNKVAKRNKTIIEHISIHVN